MDVSFITPHLALVLIMFVAFGGHQRGTFVSGVFRHHLDGLDGQSQSLAREPVPEHLKSVVTCKLGQPHPTYSECRCGEHAVRVPESEVSAENRGEYHVRIKTTIRGLKHIYYYCLFCSLCEDGVRTKTNCTQREDTQCMTGVCKDPTHIYDKGRRGCFPDPARVTSTESPTTRKGETSRIMNTVDQPRAPSDSAGNTDFSTGKEGQSMTSSLHYLTILACFIAVSMLIVLVVNIYVCYYFWQKKKKTEDKEEQEGMISRSSSRSSGIAAP